MIYTALPVGLLLLCGACQRQGEQVPVTGNNLSLKLPDPEQEWVRKKGVLQRFTLNADGDTVSVESFDRLARLNYRLLRNCHTLELVFEDSVFYSGNRTLPDSHHVRRSIKYDRHDYSRFRHTVFTRESIRYYWYSGMNWLLQTRSSESPADVYTLFDFDTSGTLIYQLKKEGNIRLTQYFYDTAGRLIKDSLHAPIYNGSLASYEHAYYCQRSPANGYTRYYYSDNVPDSFDTYHSFIDHLSSPTRRRETVHFNTEGLRQKLIIADTSPRGVITYSEMQYHYRFKPASSSENVVPNPGRQRR